LFVYLYSSPIVLLFIYIYFQKRIGPIIYLYLFSVMQWSYLFIYTII